MTVSEESKLRMTLTVGLDDNTDSVQTLKRMINYGLISEDDKVQVSIGYMTTVPGTVKSFLEANDQNEVDEQPSKTTTPHRFKTGDHVRYDNGDITVHGNLLGVVQETGPVTTWIVGFTSPSFIQTDRGMWQAAIVPECLLTRL